MIDQHIFNRLLADVAGAIAADTLAHRIEAARGGSPSGWQQLPLDLAALAPTTPAGKVCPLCGGHLAGNTCERCGMELDL